MRFNFLFAVLLTACCCLFTGCGQLYSSAGVFSRYDSTVLKTSSSADVLGVVYDPESEFLTQSESVIASWGEKAKGSVLWFNVVAFDEEQLTAIRKYGFAANEKSRSFFVKPSQKLTFDAELVLSEEILEEPYSSENTRRIAILRAILKSFNEDVADLVADSRVLTSGTMMTRQTINAILTKLEVSPAYAIEMMNASGMEFDHITLGKGRVRLTTYDDIAKVEMMIGTEWFNRTKSF